MQTQSNWIDLCDTSDLVANSGVCALYQQTQIALFSLPEQGQIKVFALSNWDPIGKAAVMYRGLTGSVKGRPVVASPLHKQRYCLDTGECLDDDQAQLATYPVQITGNRVLVQVDA